MTTYNWTIPLVEYTNDNDKGVLTAHWRCTAEDGDYISSAYGTAGFEPDPTASDFVPFDQLTEAEVLAWVYASVDKDEMEANLAKQIEEQKAPKTVAGVPWG